ncbi:MAG: gamma-glutamyltransferase, partial [Gemmatimonadota bacterium]
MALPWSNGLFAAGVSIAASGGHFLRVMPKPGDRATAYVAPNLIMKNGRPVLASGSPSVGLIA